MDMPGMIRVSPTATCRISGSSSKGSRILHLGSWFKMIASHFWALRANPFCRSLVMTSLVIFLVVGTKSQGSSTSQITKVSWN